MPSRVRMVFYYGASNLYKGAAARKELLRLWPECPYLRPLQPAALLGWFAKKQKAKPKSLANFRLNIWRARRGSREDGKEYMRWFGTRQRATVRLPPPRRSGDMTLRERLNRLVPTRISNWASDIQNNLRDPNQGAQNVNP